MTIVKRPLVRVASLMLATLAAGIAHANITDDFNRPNDANVGNGWVEKNPGAFSLASNTAAKLSVGTGYRDNIVYRPSGENVLDAEASVEFRLTSATPGYPQVLVRVQTATVNNGDWLDGYMLYVSNSASQAILGRQTGNAFVTALGTLTLSPALNTTDLFRLRLSAQGTNPVQLRSFVERFNAGSWQIIGQSIVDDADPGRIATAGSVGFSGYVENAYAYDNFVRVNLGAAGNPVPTTSGLSPASAGQGEAGLTLTVTGTGFIGSSVVRWNGAARTTTFVSATELEATITAADLSAAGNAAITVFSPAPGGGTSNAQTFTITPADQPNPTPTTTGLSPASAVAGSAGFTLTVDGTNFASTAVVQWNGANRSTGFVSPSRLTATIPASDIATNGTATVRVFNPAPGGGLSNAQTFTITASNPVPTATTLNPSSTIAGSGAFVLIVNGTGFVNGAIVRWNGSNRTTTFGSSTQLTANITASDVASQGTRTVTVFNPTPGGGTSNGLTFTIDSSGGGGPGGFSISSLSPQSAIAGQGSLLVTVNGSGFASNNVVRWNGNDRSTQFLSSTQLRVTLTASDVQSGGLGALSVRNPSTSAVTAPATFFLLTSAQSFFADNFNRTNNANIGNNWTEKSPTVFSITGGEVIGLENFETFPYHNAMVYRPSGEDRRDVEVSVEFRRTAQSGGIDGFPQLHARVQRNTVAQTNTLHSYIFFVDDFEAAPGRAIIAVQPPNPSQYECYISAINFPSALVQGQRYRLLLRVTGVLPVNLQGIVERWDGSSWQLFAQGSVSHSFSTPVNPNLYCAQGSMPSPISDAGTFGISKWSTISDPYDNFHWVSLDSGTTPPTIGVLSPSSATAGGGAFQLTVTGGGFTSGSVVRWNGSNRTTTFLSGTQVRASITAADIAAAGNASVTVFNSGTGSSNAATFTISPPLAGGFTDDFNRADSDALGNGWVEKSPAAFFITAGAADKRAVSSGYRDNVVYRPAAENVLDMQATMQFRLRGASVGYPQLFARIQTGTVGVADTLDAYMVYFNNSTNEAILGRQRGNAFVQTLATFPLSASLNTTDTYRMRLSTTGTTSVQLNAWIERLSGGTWQALGQTSFADTSASRISTAGSTGFGGYIESSYVFDDFVRQ